MNGIRIFLNFVTLSFRSNSSSCFLSNVGELTNVVAGFGFTGYKEDGSENWDMINNANIWGVEVGP